MPSLPRIRSRSRGTREVVAPPAREPAELALTASPGFTSTRRRARKQWRSPSASGGTHSTSRTCCRSGSAKVDEYDDYRFIVLHASVYDKSVQRLNAGELDASSGLTTS